MKSVIKKFENQLFFSTFLFLITISVAVSLTKYFWIANETHYFAAVLNQIPQTDDIIHHIYSLIRSPFYSLFSIVFVNNTLFFITSIFINLFFPILFYFITNRVFKNKIGAMIIGLMATPFVIDLPILVFDNFLNLGHLFSSTLKSLFVPGAFGLIPFGEAFSVRHLSTASFIFALYYFLKNNNKAFYVAQLLMFVFHPNLGITYSILFIVCQLIMKFSVKEYYLPRYNIIKMCIVVILGLIPGLIKLSSIESNISMNMSNYEWYANMIRNEYDDFSAIFIFSMRPIFTTIKIIFSLFLVFIVSYFPFKNLKTHSSNLKKKIVILGIVPVLIFLLSIIYEFLILSFQSSLFLGLYIPSQIGAKILHIGYVTNILLISFIICNIIPKHLTAQLKRIYLLVFMLIGFGLSVFLVNNKKGFNKAVANYSALFIGQNKTYLEQHIIKNDLKGFLPKIRYLPDQNKNDQVNLKNFVDKKDFYPVFNNNEYYEYFNYLSYLSLIKLIKENIPIKKSIITPPYFKGFRDFLPEYSIFFQEHHDGNLMLGSKKVASELIYRMKLLVGHKYHDLPLNFPTSPYFDTILRDEFLAISKNSILNVIKKYPDYEYFITEKKHVLDFEIAFQNEHYICYKIN